jgi:ATP-dependent protease HslVU (ClpYQ) peptidase subunit
MRKRKANNFKVTVSKDGYKPKTVLVKKFVAGFAGDTADTTGATINKVWSGLVRYTPNPIFVKLEPSWTRR